MDSHGIIRREVYGVFRFNAKNTPRSARQKIWIFIIFSSIPPPSIRPFRVGVLAYEFWGCGGVKQKLTTGRALSGLFADIVRSSVGTKSL